MRLRTYLVLLVLLAVVPVVAYSALVTVDASRQHREATERGMLETARALSLAVEKELDASVATLQALATSRYLDKGELGDFYEQAQKVAAGRGWYTVFLADRAGRQVLSLQRTLGASLPSVADRGFFQRVVATGRPQVSNLIADSIGRGYYLAIAVPVSRGGHVRYVLAAGIRPDALGSMLAARVVDPRGIASIVDGNQVVIARTPDAAEYFAKPAAPGYAAAVREAAEGLVRTRSLEGDEIYGAFRRIPTSGWTVGVGVPVEAVQAPLRRSLWHVLASGLAVLGAAVGLAILFGRRLAAAVHDARESARALATGTAVTPQPSAVCELGELGVAIGEAGRLLEQQRSARERSDRERFEVLERERAARAEAEHAAEMLRRLQRVTDTAISGRGLNDLLRELLRRVREALGADTATVLLLDDGGTALLPVASEGLREMVQEQVRVPLGHGFSGRIAASGQTLIVPDVSEIETVSRFLRDRLRSLLGAPLRIGNRVIGVIHVGALTRRDFTPEDARLLELVAHRVAVAVERARLHDAERAAREAAEVARAEAEVANQAKDEFLAVLSHELRTPLTAMLGWVRMLRTGRLDPDRTTRALETIERNTRLQAQLINDLLDVSRIVAGKLHVDHRPVDLVAVVESALGATRPEAEAKGVQVTSTLDPAAGPVWGDPVRLEQVAVNLLGNAVKFTPAGGTVGVTLERVGSHVVLTVADTGIGIAPDLLPHVFDRFRQGEAGFTRQHRGLGLGLAIVRHLVERHGGRVRAESRGAGQGATFTVELPVMPMQLPLLRGDRADGRLDGRGRLDGVRLLVVEDDPDSREMIGDALREAGAAVTTVTNADEALDALGNGIGFDALVSDVGLPGRDGYDLLRDVRRREAERADPRLPAIAVTGFATVEDRDRALAGGFQAHLAKPIDPSDLIETVAKVVQANVVGRKDGR